MMRKHILITLVSVFIAGFCCQSVPAQLPGGLKIPKVSKPKPKPTPTETAKPSLSGESQPASPNEPQPAASSAPAAQSQPGAGSGAVAVLKNLVRVNARTVTSYKGDGSTYSWTPDIRFDTGGNIPSGAQYHATVSLPNGALWVEVDCKWMGSPNNYYQCGGPDFPEEKGTTATGLFPFTIKLRNELQGTDQTLFTGKVRIEKSPGDNGTPAERAKKSFFYPVHDWAMPIGYVFYGPEENYLYTSFWVRGGTTNNIQPHVFYKGKELDYAGTDKSSCKDRAEVGDAYIRSVKPAPVWRLVECRLYTVIVRDKGNKDDTRHRLMSNPGEYEIKVLRDDELARSIKFTVGPGGDFGGGIPLLYGIDARNDERLSGVIVPVQIIGTQDGTWDKNAWKTEAFYGNPPQGFTPAP
jgi:hypothetical protein